MTTDRPSSHDAETAPVSSRSTSSAEAISKMLSAERVPERIGEYRILKQIGSGGMGLVYLAQRGESSYSQMVALKVIKKGMDSEEIIRRFELERQLLSGLNHPNIARLIDGGTTEDGRPFFALEHVDGQPIDKYCDANKLSTRDRLAIFRKVCSAVHYAHQNLIVHRDLKPGNVLINAQGEPKLLDFGIAKLLNPSLFQVIAVTGATVRLMTPEYASPEQVKGESITTASDIYSLGVMLYELLTGRRPYKFKTRLQQEIIRIVCEESPERPSTVISRSDEEPIGEGQTRRVDPTTVAQTREGDLDRLRRKLKGDIDDIVLKAMDKTPTRRYASAEQFSADIARHLSGEPVIARPPSVVYRAGKFVQRNRGAVAASTAVVGALALGFVGTSVQWARAERARDAAVLAQAAEAAQRAEADAARAREAEGRQAAEAARDLAEKSYKDTWDVLDSYIGDVHAAVAKLPGAVEAREVIVETATKKMQSLADLWKADPAKQAVVAGGYERLGQLSADIRGGSKGGVARAMELQKTALAMRREHLEREPASPERQLAVASSLVRIGDLRGLMNEQSGKVEAYDEARRMLEPLAPNLALARTMLAAVLGQLGDHRRDEGDLAAALALYEQGQAIRAQIRDSAVAAAVAANLSDKEQRQRRTQSMQARRNFTVGLMDLGRTKFDLGDREPGLSLFAEAVSERRALLAEEPGQARTQRDLAVALLLSSEMLSKAGKHADAVRESAEAVDLMSRLTAQEAQSNRPDARNLSTLGNCRAGLAAAQTAAAAASEDRAGALEAALRSWSAASELFAERSAGDADNAELRVFLADSRSGEADCLHELGRQPEAVEAADRALTLLRPLAAASPNDRSLTRSLVIALGRSGRASAAISSDGGLPVPTRETAREKARTAYQEALAFAAAPGMAAALRDTAFNEEALRRALAELDAPASGRTP